MRRFHPFVAAALIALAAVANPPAALAQQTASADLQAQMTPAQFKAAGLDKLSASELAALNDWLQGKVQQETTQAVEEVKLATARVAEQAKEEGRQEVIVKNRGFFDFGSSEPIQSRLAGEFTGFAKGRHYLLENGQEWEQVEPATLAGVRKSNPAVSIKPGVTGVWYLKIDGYNTAAKVRRIK